MMVIGGLIVSLLRRYPTVWKTFFSQHKIINQGIGVDRAENVLWHVHDIVQPKSLRSVVINCSTNNIDTTYSDKIK